MSGQPYNPKDRIKKHLKRKSSSRCLQFVETSPSATFTLNALGVGTESCPPLSSSNPFKTTSPQRKRRPPETLAALGEDDENAQNCFDAAKALKHGTVEARSVDVFPSTSHCQHKISTEKTNIGLERFKSFDTSLVQDMHAIDFSHLMSQEVIGVEKENERGTEQGDEFPLDFRVGTKLRVVTQVPFPWMTSRRNTGIVAVRIPALDRYNGMKYFTESHSTHNKNSDFVQNSASDMSILEAASLYWQYPVIPGMTLYPRITSELKQIDRVPLAPLSIKTMSDQWVECFEQLFMSYKKGERENFFVASAVFNVFFTKTANISDDVDVSEESQSCSRSFGGQRLMALVSHTNSSTREHLRTQGVDYEIIGSKTTKRDRSFPAFDQFSQSSFKSPRFELNEDSLIEVEQESHLHENKIDDFESSDDENDSPTKANQEWLKNIGVSPRNVMKKSSRRKLTAPVSDQEGIFCLLVKGAAVQSLYNTLMSSDIVHEKTGPYTKIPPTLLAISPFLYSQLLSLDKTSQVIHKACSKHTEYVFELNGGPVLPHCAKLIAKFLRNSNLCEKAAAIQVSDRHSNNGMNECTNRATNWNIVQVLPDCFKWKKIIF